LPGFTPFEIPVPARMRAAVGIGAAVVLRIARGAGIRLGFEIGSICFFAIFYTPLRCP
jgi:hypothetical protein